MLLAGAMVNCSELNSELNVRRQSLARTKQLHGGLVVCGLCELAFYATKLVRFYGLNNDISAARQVFEQTAHRSVFLWNSIIRAYARSYRLNTALYFYQRMVESLTCPDNFTFACLIRASHECFNSYGVRHVHGAAIIYGFGLNSICCSTLVTGYSKLGLMGEATKVFYQISVPDLVLWNAVMCGCASGGNWFKGLQLFNQMRRENKFQPDGYSYTGLISSIIDDCWLQNGLALHGLLFKSGHEHKPHVSSSLISMYSRFRYMDSGYKLFKGLTQPDMVTWSALITGFSNSGDFSKAFFLFNDLVSNGRKTDPVLISCVLTAISQSTNVTLGTAVHCIVLREGHEIDTVVSSALINMYSKCGFLAFGVRIFENLQVRNIVTFNTIISAFGFHGFYSRCFQMFEEILKIGLRPDESTFSVLLSACCHCGRIIEGCQLYWRMINQFDIEARPEHNILLVKLLCLAGKWDQACDLIGSLKQPVDISVWEALLSSCYTHGNSHLAKVVAKKLMNDGPEEAPNVVMVSNMYASEGRWDFAERVRKKITVENSKLPGYSWAL